MKDLFMSHWQLLEPEFNAQAEKLARLVMDRGCDGPAEQGSDLPHTAGEGIPLNYFNRGISLHWHRETTGDIPFLSVKIGLYGFEPKKNSGLKESFGTTMRLDMPALNYAVMLMPRPRGAHHDISVVQANFARQCESLEDMAKDITFRLDRAREPAMLASLGDFYDHDHPAYQPIIMSPSSWYKV